MKKLMHTIRKEFSFSPEIEPCLERRLFRLLCLTISFIMFFLLIPANYLQNLPPAVNITLALLGGGSLLLYRAALAGKHCNNTLLVMMLATINVVWFFNGGSDGSVPYFFFPICMYPLIIFHGRKRWTALAAIIVNGCLLLWLSYRFPWLVIAYESPYARAADLMVGLVISALASVMVLWVVLCTYMREHERLNLLNLKLEHEISVRMRREGEIRTLAGEHRLILDTIPMGIIYVKEYKTQWANPAYEKMFGYSLQELLGMDNALHYAENADYIRVVIEGYDRVANGERFTTEARMRKKDGTRFRCSMTGCAVNPENPAEGSIWMVQDISEQKQVENDLRESEERYRGLVELSPDAIYIHSKGKLVFVNSRGAELLGADRPEQLYGREVLDFVHADSLEFVKKRIAKAFQSGEQSLPVEEKFVRLDGSPVVVEVSSVPFGYRGEAALQVFAREIGERKKIQEELLKAQKLESLGVLAGGIAHDFNNLLTGIMGNISLAKINLDPALVINERLDLCEKAAVQASKLTRQLLTFARGGEPFRKLIDIVPLLWDAASFSLRGSKIRSSVEIADNLWCTEADSGQISQVLHNLLFNAAQAMPDGGEVNIRAVNETLPVDNLLQLQAGSYLKISIEDQGCGIPQENLARIFDPYFSTKPQGSGLGLASVYSIVKRHCGAVEVTSTMGEGSCFTVYFPANRCGKVENESDSAAATLNGSGRVLVMDDEELVRNTLAAMLEAIGYRVESCIDGEEAVARFNEDRGHDAPFAAVILDLTVPGGMGGKEAARIMREIDDRAVLIVSSGYSSDPVIANYRQYGFNGAIVKPFDVNMVSEELRRCCANVN